MIYNKRNSNLFPEEGVKYTCNMCDKDINIDNSVSYHGYNLICTGCLYKISALLDLVPSETLKMLQSAGEKIFTGTRRIICVRYL